MNIQNIPIAGTYDLAVVGGAVRAVAAAVAAANAGLRVLLAAPRTSLGDDLCATLRLWRQDGDAPSPWPPLAERLFDHGNPARPLHVKKQLDEALIAAGVDFLFGCHATEILRDAEGLPAGIVMVNRAGRQAVVATAIIDATDGASVARSAGARFVDRPPAQPQTTRVVVAEQGPATARRRPVDDGEPGLFYVEHHLDLPSPGTTLADLAEAEQLARDLTCRRGQLRGAETLFQMPAAAIVGRGETICQGGTDTLELGHFQPTAVDRLFVLGPCADLPAPLAAGLRQPGWGATIGQWLGERLGEQIRPGRPPVPVAADAANAGQPAAGTIKERLGGWRSAGQPTATLLASRPNPPVVGEYDVVVVGGGTAGAAAAIAAGRQGAQVLVVEAQEGLGGTGTLGMIGRPYHGLHVGFAKEVPFSDDPCTTEDKMEWFRQQIRQTGGTIWLSTLASGVLLAGSQVKGVLVANANGHGVVLAKALVDATGNADLAAAAGADCQYGDDPDDIAMQGAGLPARPLRDSNANTDFLLVDETDLLDVDRALVGARWAMSDTDYDVAPLLQTRERRRVVADHQLSYLDQIAGRTYPDSVVQSASDCDSHGYPSLPYFAMLPHDAQSRRQNHPAPGGTCFTPYRCLLPKGLGGLLVVGLGMGMHRDAAALVRMQRDLHNQGYAAGRAAAMAAQGNCCVRDIDLPALQRHLVEIGNLPPEVLEHGDSLPLAPAAIEQAVYEFGAARQPTAAGRPLAIILSHAKLAHPILAAAFEQASDPDRLNYAKPLAWLGDRRVLPFLLDQLGHVAAWDDRILQGQMAEYAHLPTPVDGLILALGWLRRQEALPALLAWLARLDAEVTLSHHRALALALEKLAAPAAAQPLANLLGKPGMRGHAMPRLVPLPNQPPASRHRLPSLREIVLVRALYRCGDHQGLGETILRDYRQDLRGLFRRHATAVLGPEAAA